VRKAATALGIIAGIFGVIHTSFSWIPYYTFYRGIPYGSLRWFAHYDAPEWLWRYLTEFELVYLIMGVVASVVMIIGGALAQRRPVVGGTMALVAAAAAFFTSPGFLVGVLGIIGGCLALGGRGPQHAPKPRYVPAPRYMPGYPGAGGPVYMGPPGARPYGAAPVYQLVPVVPVQSAPWPGAQPPQAPSGQWPGAPMGAGPAPSAPQGGVGPQGVALQGSVASQGGAECGGATPQAAGAPTGATQAAGGPGGFCQGCGLPSVEGSRFCMGCGRPL
jgi:hypothetical protein